MLSFRLVPRPASADPVAPPVAIPDLDAVHESQLVPCNNLRARWVVGAAGQLELRWELPQARSQAEAA